MKYVDNIINRVNREIDEQESQGIDIDEYPWQYDSEVYVLVEEVERLRWLLKEAHR